MLRPGCIRLAAALFIAALPVTSPAQEMAWTSTSRPLFVDAPPGFVAACRVYDWVCSNVSGKLPRLSEEQLRRLGTAVNREVNREIKQVSDHELYGTAERWALPDRGRGDCEDLALEKMRRLLDRGVPAHRLAMAIGLDRHGNNHAVLLLKVNEDYFVLDSLNDRVISLAETPYRMLAMQESENRGRWKLVESVVSVHTAIAQRAPGKTSTEAYRGFAGNRTNDR